MRAYGKLGVWTVSWFFSGWHLAYRVGQHERGREPRRAWFGNGSMQGERMSVIPCPALWAKSGMRAAPANNVPGIPIHCFCLPPNNSALVLGPGGALLKTYVPQA